MSFTSWLASTAGDGRRMQGTTQTDPSAIDGKRGLPDKLGCRITGKKGLQVDGALSVLWV